MITEQNLAELFGITPIAVQLLLFAVSFLLGMLIILLYTAYSALIDKWFPLKGWKRRSAFSFSDICFWIVMAICAFLLYYKIDDAQIRTYYFLFILCGMTVAYNIKLEIIKWRKNM